MKYKWLNEHSRTFLKRGYLIDDITPEERIQQIAKTANKYLKIDGFEEKFIEYMSAGYYSLSSPIWANFGLERGLPISCFGSYVPDSVEGIMGTASEIGMMSKVGGGTSAYFGHVRPRGSSITNNGQSNGSFSFVPLFETIVDTISQGTSRKGQCAVYIDIEHPDIHEWLNIHTEGNPIQLIYWGVCIGDKWLQEMEAGDVEKRGVWAKVLQRRSETGIPYIFFKDNVNNNKPEVYKDETIYASNLCLTGDQRVVTSKGYLTAKELYELGEELELFDGEKMVKSSPMLMRNENTEILKITYANGMTQKVTFNHGIPVMNDTRKPPVRVEAKDLKVGDYVALQTNKGLFGELHMTDEAYLLGLYQSDGTQHKDNLMIDIWQNDFDLIDEIQSKFDDIHYKYGCDVYGIKNKIGNVIGFRNRTPARFVDATVKYSPVKKKRLTSRTLKKSLNFEKGYVPDWIWKSDEETIWAYLKGLLYADGTVSIPKSKGEPIQIAYSDVNREFLTQLQILFTNLGCNCSIHLLRKGGLSLLPDGKGGYKYYNTKDCWRLIFGSKNDALIIENNTGFLSRKKVFIENRKYRNNSKKRTKIVSIEQVENEPVYCPTVYNDEHIFISNGLKTFNCSEIALPSIDEESFVCCLSSMNLLHYDEWKNTDAVEILTYFLDAVMEEFIQKGKNIKYLDRAVRFAVNHRALGIGVLGWHSYLQKNNVPFESFQAMQKNAEIFKFIQSKTNIGSEKMYEMFGSPAGYIDLKRRNTTLMSVAPTKSSSFILGQVSPSIEPYKSNYYIKDLAKIKVPFKNPFLEELLQQKSQNNEVVWNSILSKDGSVQHLDFLTDHEKDVFKTFKEISQLSIIQQAAQRQEYIDQSQSLNVMIHPSTPLKDINTLYLTAWKSGIKTLYYQINLSAAQEFNRNILDCVVCES